MFEQYAVSVGYLEIGDSVMDASEEIWGTVLSVEWFADEDIPVIVAVDIDWGNGIAHEEMPVNGGVCIQRLM